MIKKCYKDFICKAHETTFEVKLQLFKMLSSFFFEIYLVYLGVTNIVYRYIGSIKRLEEIACTQILL
jgi:hypothetical protein